MQAQSESMTKEAPAKFHYETDFSLFKDKLEDKYKYFGTRFTETERNNYPKAYECYRALGVLIRQWEKGTQMNFSSCLYELQSILVTVNKEPDKGWFGSTKIHQLTVSLIEIARHYQQFNAQIRRAESELTSAQGVSPAAQDDKRIEELLKRFDELEKKQEEDLKRYAAEEDKRFTERLAVYAEESRQKAERAMDELLGQLYDTMKRLQSNRDNDAEWDKAFALISSREKLALPSTQNPVSVSSSGSTSSTTPQHMPLPTLFAANKTTTSNDKAASEKGIVEFKKIKRISAERKDLILSLMTFSLNTSEAPVFERVRNWIIFELITQSNKTAVDILNSIKQWCKVQEPPLPIENYLLRLVTNEINALIEKDITVNSAATDSDFAAHDSKRLRYFYKYSLPDRVADEYFLHWSGYGDYCDPAVKDKNRVAQFAKKPTPAVEHYRNELLKESKQHNAQQEESSAEKVTSLTLN